MCSVGQTGSPPEQKNRFLVFHNPCKVGVLVKNMEQCSIMAVPEPCKPQPK
jgi:hypothetical protein